MKVRRPPRPRGNRAQPILTFAVIADTHVRAEAPNTATPRENRRTAHVLRQLEMRKPAFVLHLGDVVHPLPALDEYPAVAENANRLHGMLSCPLYVTPGNHDIGDKTSPWMPAKAVQQNWINMHRQRFGPVFRAFAHASCRFILICSPILGSGLPDEARQREWLEQELAVHAGSRVFLATHYPPYLLKPDEPDNYDNICLRERKWLLGLVERYKVEALFFGHIHNFLYNRHGPTHCYALPSVSFVRRDYAELFRVAPDEQDEFGRNDRGRLGYFMVDVLDAGHVVRPISTEGACQDEASETLHWTTGPHPVEVPRTALGVHARHAWNEVVALPYNSPTDEFQRRFVRNDYPLRALWQMGVAKLRIPLSEFCSPESASRLAALQATGQKFTVFTAGVPDDRHAQILKRHAKLADGWEVVLPRASLASDLDAVADLRRETGLVTTISPLVSSRDDMDASAAFRHVSWSGLDPSQSTATAELVAIPGAARAFDRLGFRIGQAIEPWTGVKSAMDVAGHLGFGAAITVCLAPEGPDDANLDETWLANRVAIAAIAAVARPQAEVFLDTFMDVDRGYYVRHGLADRRGSLRLPGRAMARMHALLNGIPPGGEIESHDLGHGNQVFVYFSDGFELALFLPTGPSSATPEALAGAANLLPARPELVAVSLASGDFVECSAHRASELSLPWPMAVLPTE